MPCDLPSIYLIDDLAELKTVLICVSYVVALISYVTLNSRFSPASLAGLIAEVADVTIAEQKSMIQFGDMSTSQLTSTCARYN